MVRYVLMSNSTVILVLSKIPWMVICLLLVGNRSWSVVNMRPNYRTVLSPATGFGGSTLISCCRADCAVKLALKWGIALTLMSCDLQCDFSVTELCACKFSMHVKYVACFCSDLCRSFYFLFWFSLCRQSKVNFKETSDAPTGAWFCHPSSP